MATAKPKTKRMMFGGIAKGAANAVKKAVAAKPRHPTLAPQGGRPTPRHPTLAPKPGGMGSRPPSQVMQFMSDAVRNAAAGKPGRGGRPSVMGPKPPGGVGPRRPMQGGGVKPAGIGQAMNRPKTNVLGAAITGAGRGLGMGKKKGGAVKKATKK